MSITHAAAASADRLDLACASDADDVGIPSTSLLRWDRGAWAVLHIEQHAQSLCQWRDKTGETSLLVMSRERTLIDVDGGGPAVNVEDISLHGKPYQFGFLNQLRQVGSTLYAVGAGGQAYLREGNAAWRVLSEELLDGPFPDRNWILDYARDPKLLEDPETKRIFDERLDSESPKIFWTVSAASEQSVYFGGEQAGGLLCFWDGLRVSRCELPVRDAIRDILIAPGGTVWACGREGILLKGYGLRFDVALDLGPEYRFASLSWFKDRLYIGSSSGPVALLAFDGKAAQPVETGLATEVVDAHTIQSAGGVLWVVGTKSVARFDGQKWVRIPVPGIGD